MLLLCLQVACVVCGKAKYCSQECRYLDKDSHAMICRILVQASQVGVEYTAHTIILSGTMTLKVSCKVAGCHVVGRWECCCLCCGGSSYAMQWDNCGYIHGIITVLFTNN